MVEDNPKRPRFEAELRMRRELASLKIDWLVLLLFCAALLLDISLGLQAPVGAATEGPSSPLSQSGIAGWSEIGSYVRSTLSAGEGLATVTPPRHKAYELYRGIASISSDLKAQGWAHIGDVDSVHGYVFDAYQGPSSGSSKMFLVTNPSGKSFEYRHTLVRGELYNNSFDAISPNTQWLVAGEWGTMSHLQIYPTPLLNHDSPSHGGSLELAGYIKLDHKVNDVQGCDFVTPVRLICASDDDSRTLFLNEKPLLEVDLLTSVHDANVKGHVVDLGSIPQRSGCSGTFEVEGVDFDATTGILRVEIIQPGACILKTSVYEYRRARGRG
jgi:hypothetical protein